MNSPDVHTRDILRSRALELEQASSMEGVLFSDSEQGFRCSACAHRCVLEDGSVGACKVRVRRGQSLRVPGGYVARKYVRAVETNTIFHVRPGAKALTFGMYGCDLRCPYCHNHKLSQAFRDVGAGGPILPTTAQALVTEALGEGCEVLCAAYNEPLVSAEWTHAVFAEGRRRGLVTALITDGHSTREALEYMRPVTDVFRVDLKGYDDAQYKVLGGRLAPVLDSLATAKALGYWVEVVTLVVPGFNDDRRGLRFLCDAIRAIDPNIPWHLDAFQPRYRMTDRPAMPAGPLFDAAASAYARGMSFVYVGNVTNDAFAATRCPGCHATLIERHDWSCRSSTLRDGRCPSCSLELPGLW